MKHNVVVDKRTMFEESYLCLIWELAIGV